MWLEFKDGKIKDLQSVHETLYEHLQHKGFIVPDEDDEVLRVIETLQNEDTNEEIFTIIVNPTLDCNMHCWYCYERHQKNTQMSPEVMESVINLIRAKAEYPKLKFINLSFFGGEPLLYYDTTVLPLLEAANKICNEKGKFLTVSFTSNSFLITPKIVYDLKGLNLANPIHWQITLDGNQMIHNRIRHTKKGEKTYNKIISNILCLAHNGMTVTVRMNYQIKNLLCFLDIIDDFCNQPQNRLRNIKFKFQRVWQDVSNLSNEEISHQVRQVENAFIEAGLEFEDSYNRPKRCYADMENGIVINYDGKVYKCTAQDFKSSNAEGLLQDNGSVQYNSIYQHRMKSKYINRSCLKCKIYPICFGGCSQHLMNEHNDCIKNYTDNDKSNIVKERIRILSNLF